MNINMDIATVAECSIINCAYNNERVCHAKAITIGDKETPHCDTLCCDLGHVHGNAMHAGVGACKVSTCAYNDDLECGAESITVGMLDSKVRCLTYATR